MAESPSAAATEWTTRRLLKWMREYFTERGVDAPRVCAEMLLAHVIGCERMELYMKQDRPAAPLERERLRELVARAGRHEPVQYLVGRAWFFSREFEVSPATLIPRPETETLVENVLRHQRSSATASPSPLIADIGVGTGVIAISLAIQLPSARIIATDTSDEILDLARRNAERHGVGERIELHRGSLYEPLEDSPSRGRFDYICSNPPYIPDDEWRAVAANVRDYEPHSALRGGVDGLQFIQPLVENAARFLQSGGLLAIEIPESRAEKVRAIAEGTAGLEEVRIAMDHEKRPRVLLAQGKGM